MRLLAAAMVVAAIHAGCSLDDRVLTEAPSGSGGSGGGGGGRCQLGSDNPCEECLATYCCDEASACGAGSACIVYLNCAEACAGDQNCLNRCAANSPAGFGDALALGVCSQTQCPVCGGVERGEAFETCDPNGFGSCQSSADCSALSSGALESLDVATCPACEELGAPECASCLSAQTGLSVACSGCVAEWLSCAVVNCVLECEVAADSVACSDCLALAGCTTQLGSCGFSG